MLTGTPRQLRDIRSDFERGVFLAVYNSRSQRLHRTLARIILGIKHGLRGAAFSWPLYLLPLAAWNEAAFGAESIGAALQEGMGSDAVTDSPEVTITAPDNPENGAVVPVEVTTTLAGVQSIALLVEKNVRPLCGVFQLGKRTKPQVSIRVKVGESSDVIAVVKSGDKLYSARKPVKVTIGGCG